MTLDSQKGIIVKSTGGLYGVCPISDHEDSTSRQTVMCRARGVFRHESITPLVGDTVCFEHDIPTKKSERQKALSSAEHVITEILPRRNSLIRPPLANLTHLFIVIPATHPEPDLLVADKLISIAEFNGIEPVILVNKSDLSKDSAEMITSVYSPNFSVFTVNAYDNDSIVKLREFISDTANNAESTVIAAFAGVSGAGKSTLLTALFPTLSLKSGELSRKIARGKNTTRHCELYPLSSRQGLCFIADTPGFSLLDFTKFNFYPAPELPHLFREFEEHLCNCRYSNCTHTTESDCGVVTAVRDGRISVSRHDSYRAIYSDLKKIPEWKRKQMQ